ncbi:MAG: ABC transporter [Cereibacter sphaeroides]|uniref:ABC transporter n=1 Tax=Cereibacter sphaeroides TaxID=1063 RepID=A0A2W5UPY8_CERSP|nr:MAG: ABC transporter [Cereibacter sphaeroides]
MILRLLPALAFVVMSGCSAISALSGASRPLDAYTLSPVSTEGTRSGGRHMVVHASTSSGEYSSDRIVVKPNRLQTEYLPGARWIDETPVMIQSLLVDSLQKSGGYRLVGRTDGGLIPDYGLLTDIAAFQAEAPSDTMGAWQVRVGLTGTLVRDSDGSIIASRRFEQTAVAANDQTMTLVNAFDTAMQQVQQQMVAWTLSHAR